MPVTAKYIEEILGDALRGQCRATAADCEMFFLDTPYILPSGYFLQVFIERLQTGAWRVSDNSWCINILEKFFRSEEELDYTEKQLARLTRTTAYLNYSDSEGTVYYDANTLHDAILCISELAAFCGIIDRDFYGIHVDWKM